MELYECGNQMLSSDDLEVIGEDLATFVAECIKPGGRFEQIDQQHQDNFLTIPELDAYITTKKTQKSSPGPLQEAQALQKSFKAIADLNWDFVVFGPQISRTDLSQLHVKLENAIKEIKDAEALARTAQAHFFQIQKCLPRNGQPGDEVDDAQIQQYLKTARLSDSDRDQLKKLIHSPLNTFWRVRYDDLLEHPYAVERKHLNLFNTAIKIWKDLPVISYVPQRKPESIFSLSLKFVGDLIRSDDTTSPTQHLDQAEAFLTPATQPRLVPKALSHLRDAALNSPEIIHDSRFQKLAALAGGTYDPTFENFLKSKGVYSQVKAYFDVYRKNPTRSENDLSK